MTNKGHGGRSEWRLSSTCNSQDKWRKGQGSFPIPSEGYPEPEGNRRRPWPPLAGPVKLFTRAFWIQRLTWSQRDGQTDIQSRRDQYGTCQGKQHHHWVSLFSPPSPPCSLSSLSLTHLTERPSAPGALPEQNPWPQKLWEQRFISTRIPNSAADGAQLYHRTMKKFKVNGTVRW